MLHEIVKYEQLGGRHVLALIAEFQPTAVIGLYQFVGVIVATKPRR